jgi:hypothetical protein
VHPLISSDSRAVSLSTGWNISSEAVVEPFDGAWVCGEKRRPGHGQHGARKGARAGWALRRHVGERGCLSAGPCAPRAPSLRAGGLAAGRPLTPSPTSQTGERGRRGPKRDKDRGPGRARRKGQHGVAGGSTGQRETHDAHPPRAARREQRARNSDGGPTGRGQRAERAAHRRPRSPTWRRDDRQGGKPPAQS